MTARPLPPSGLPGALGTLCCDAAALGVRLDQLLMGTIGLQDLEPGLADFYDLGFINGRESLVDALAEAELAADRYYRLAFAPKAASPSFGLSYAERCRLWGEPDRAARADAAVARAFNRGSRAKA